MADDADVAGQQMDRELEALIDARPRFVGTSALHCMECGADIPAARREQIPGVTLCVDCQTVNEAQARHYR